MGQSTCWILLLLLTGFLEIQARSGGPPLSSGTFDLICNQLMPNHGGASAQAGNGGYIITTNIPRSGSTRYGYTAGQTYTVTLSGSANTFLGFLVIAHVPGQNNMLLGVFTPQNANQQTLNCDSVGAATTATIAHSNSGRTQFSSMTFMWQAPSGSDGTVDFRYSVVQEYSIFFVRQSAAANDPTPIPTSPPPTTPPPTTPPPTTLPPTTLPPTTLPPTTLPPTTLPPTTLPPTTLPPTTPLPTTSPPTTPPPTTTILTTTQTLATTTQSPASTTRSDVTTTQSTTQFDVTTTQSLGTTTQSDVTTTQSTTQFDVTTTQSPGITTQLEVTTTQSTPDTTTQTDVITTQVPETTTQSTPETTTQMDVTTTQAPETTTQSITTQTDVTTTQAPATTTQSTPETTTQTDVTTTQTPATTTQSTPETTTQTDVTTTQAPATTTPETTTQTDVTSTQTLGTDSTTTSPLTTTDVTTNQQPEPTTAPTTDGGNNLIAPTTEAMDYRLTFRNPSNCTPENCDIFVGIDTNTGNSGYLDIYLEGQANGWLAVGFSNTSDMNSADVVACNRDPSTNMVEALDAWNLQRFKSNDVDTIQDVVLFSGNYNNGRITCSGAKKIAPSGVEQDFDLNNEYFILYGQRRGDAFRGLLLAHEMTLGANPIVSSITFNPVSATDESAITPTTITDGIIAPTIAAEDYRLTFRSPSNCTPSECAIFVGIGTNTGNSGYLDIYLEGQADGWVAVGFSNTSDMNSADVVACNRDPSTNMLEALDAWNLQSSKSNDVDTIQDVVLFLGNYNNGRITCSIGKKIAPSGIDQDFDLNDDYFVLYGQRRGNSFQGFLYPHEMEPGANPISTSMTFNPVTAIDESAVTPSITTGGVIAPTIAADDYRLTFRIPSNCAPAQCEVFVGIGTNTGNSSYLDIYLEGQADGWVAVGFSKTSDMNSADIVACNRDPGTDIISSFDAWNIQSSKGNQIDAIQDVVLFSGNHNNGRITCSVAKRIAPSDSGQDLDLNNDYFVLYGRRVGNSNPNSLSPHELDPTTNPLISSRTVNPVVAGGSVGVFPKLPLLRFHGILMIIAWPLLAVCGIFFASWMRPALPKGQWFQVHRAFLLASMFIGAAGFVVAFIANHPSSGLITLGSNNPAGTAHFSIGIIVMLLHIVNPIISAFRCEPMGEKRWIFNLCHGSIIGGLAEIAALTNACLGTFVIFGRYTALFWIFLVYCLFNLILFVILLIFFTISAHFSDGMDRKKLAPSLIKPFIAYISPPKMDAGVELVKMTQLGSESELVTEESTTSTIPDSEKPSPIKRPSEDSRTRWLCLVIYLAISVPLMIISIALVAALN